MLDSIIFPIFSDEKTKKFNNLPKVTQVESGRAASRVCALQCHAVLTHESLILLMGGIVTNFMIIVISQGEDGE